MIKTTAVPGDTGSRGTILYPETQGLDTVPYLVVGVTSFVKRKMGAGKFLHSKAAVISLTAYQVIKISVNFYFDNETPHSLRLPISTKVE